MRLFWRCVFACWLAVPFGATLGLVVTQEAEAQKGPVRPPNKAIHGRGYVLAPLNVRQGRHDRAAIRNRHWKRALPVITAPTWDSRALGLTGPVFDQDGCGNCYQQSACEVGQTAQYKAGNVAAGSGFALSRQFFLDCHPELGGCNGGDEWEVSQVMLNTGCPSVADYPGAGYNPGQCQDTSKMTMWKINAMGYCTTQIGANGIADTQDIKNCIAAYGGVSVAVAAGNEWDSYQAGQTITVAQYPPNPNGINHAVFLIGWKTSTTNTTIWLCQNSWGESFGDKGTLWIEEGADSIGTEAYWTTAVSNSPTPIPVPPPGPTPVPPGPTPVPPGPTPVPQTITFTFTPSPFSFSTGGLFPHTVTVTPPSQTVTATINSATTTTSVIPFVPPYTQSTVVESAPVSTSAACGTQATSAGSCPSGATAGRFRIFSGRVFGRR